MKLPVKQDDKDILDLVIRKAEMLRQKVHVTLGSSLPLQVGPEFSEVVYVGCAQAVTIHSCRQPCCSDILQ